MKHRKSQKGRQKTEKQENKNKNEKKKCSLKQHVTNKIVRENMDREMVHNRRFLCFPVSLFPCFSLLSKI